MINRIHPKFRPVWDGLGPHESTALARYFLPHRSKQDFLAPTRPRVVKWYCPFADQRCFPSGHRYCINVFTGCDHDCVYCYAKSYALGHPSRKPDFERALQKDMDDLEAFDVPAAPVHLSNSTDPLQKLEQEARHTFFALEQVLVHRRRFTSVVVLTKNPGRAAEPAYIELLKKLNEWPADHPRREEFAHRGLPGCRVEVSLAFGNDDSRRLLDPGAPSVDDRLEGIRRLRHAGIPVVLRIDPLFPRDSIRDKTLDEFGFPNVQPLDDLERLLAFAAEAGVMHLVYSPAKIVRQRGGSLPPLMQNLKRVYQHLSGPEKTVFRGGSWRLPPAVSDREVVHPFRELCQRYRLPTYRCKENLITTP